ncbi:MAG TPA: PfkB family carbohydrate kinase [Woeseiaceae bacterium]|nr:PfkB family carbohydrate kinase [Woeseiaceae bacterium]
MPNAAENRIVCCLGGMTMDRILTLQAPVQLGTANPASGEKLAGGMARNVAVELARLSAACKLIAVVGDDNDGRAVVADAAQQGIDTGLVQKSLSRPTGSSTAVIDPDGELFAAFADMAICDSMDRGFIQNRWIQIENSALVFADASLPPDSLSYLIAGCREHDLPLVIDATSVAGAVKLPLNLHGVELLVCTTDEARAILGDELARDPDSMAAALCRRGAAGTVVAAEAGLSLVQSEGGAARLPANEPLSASTRPAFIARALHARLRGQDWPRSLASALL